MDCENAAGAVLQGLRGKGGEERGGGGPDLKTCDSSMSMDLATGKSVPSGVRRMQSVYGMLPMSELSAHGNGHIVNGFVYPSAGSFLRKAANFQSYSKPRTACLQM